MQSIRVCCCGLEQLLFKIITQLAGDSIFDKKWLSTSSKLCIRIYYYYLRNLQPQLGSIGEHIIIIILMYRATRQYLPEAESIFEHLKDQLDRK
jgi:hypothetical protein